MSGVPYALAEAAIAQPPRQGNQSKTPPKRRTRPTADRVLSPEPR